MDIKIRIEELRLSFGKAEILKGMNIDVYKNRITGFMGPAGSGKSTLISIINRMIDFEDEVKIEGRLAIDNEDVLGADVDVVGLRRGSVRGYAFGERDDRVVGTESLTRRPSTPGCRWPAAGRRQ